MRRGLEKDNDFPGVAKLGEAGSSGPSVCPVRCSTSRLKCTLSAFSPSLLPLPQLPSNPQAATASEIRVLGLQPEPAPWPPLPTVLSFWNKPSVSGESFCSPFEAVCVCVLSWGMSPQDRRYRVNKALQTKEPPTHIVSQPSKINYRKDGHDLLRRRWMGVRECGVRGALGGFSRQSSPPAGIRGMGSSQWLSG